VAVTSDTSKPPICIRCEKKCEWKKELLPIKSIFCDYCRNMGHSLEWVKRFVNVYLHCIIRNLKKISKMSTLPPPGNISAESHVCKHHILSDSDLWKDSFKNIQLVEKIFTCFLCYLSRCTRVSHLSHQETPRAWQWSSNDLQWKRG